MAQQDIAKQLCTYIETELASGLSEGTLTPETELIESGYVDSLGLFKLVEYLEDKLHVTLEPEEIVFENFATVGDIMKLITAHQSGAAG